MELLKVSMSRNDQDKKFKTTMACISESSDTYINIQRQMIFYKIRELQGPEGQYSWQKHLGSSAGTELHDDSPKQTKEPEQQTGSRLTRTLVGKADESVQNEHWSPGGGYHSRYNWLGGLTTHQPFCFQPEVEFICCGNFSKQ